MKKIDKKLFEAIENDDVETIKQCIKEGVNVEIKDKGSLTPLMYAARKSNLDCCKILVNSGANVETKDSDGRTPLMHAVTHRSTACCEMFINIGADVNAKDNGGRTSLMYAAWQSNSDCCKMLIDAGADTRATDETGWTSLMFGTVVSAYKCCKMIIGAGSDINAENSHGWTPLMFASSADCINLLINAGAFLTIKNDEKKTALDVAIDFGYKDVEKILQDLLTFERKLMEYILLNQNTENEIFDNVRIEKMPTINPYYILSDSKTNVPVGTFTPKEGLDGIKIYDGYQTLDEAIKNEPTQTNAQRQENIIQEG